MIGLYNRVLKYSNKLYSTVENINQRIPKRIKAVQIESKPTELCKVKAYCTAESYDLTKLKLQKKPFYDILPNIGNEVVHARILKFNTADNQSIEEAKMEQSFVEEIKDEKCVKNAPEIYFFKSGSIVCWNTTEDEDKMILQDLKEYEIKKNEKIEFEEMDYKNIEMSDHMNETGHSKIQDEIIILCQSSSRDKLAFSNGLGNSVKLGVVESQLEKHIQSVRHIPEILLEGKKLPLRRSQVLQKMGELLSLRGNLNLYSELIEMPDLYWSEPYLGELYSRICHCLDIRQRVSILNKKLDYANEMAQVLRNHLSEQHSLKLEWFIIILIAVEVAFEFVHYI